MRLTACTLLALLTIGARPPDDRIHLWEIEYADGELVEYESATWELSFDERPYWSWRSRCRYPGGPWSEWTPWRPAELYPGDVDGDGIVSNADFEILRRHFLEAAP